MKVLLATITILLLISCNDGNNQPATRPPLIARDSGLVKTEAPNPYASVDVSPMDMSYFPADFPVSKMQRQVKGLPKARVIYSRPHKQGRKVFGSLIKYGQPWRLGANEATEIEFFQPVTIENKRIPRGRYILYAIPNEKSWTMVLNSNLFAWGLKIDRTQDLYQFDIPSITVAQPVEYFTIVFEQADKGANLVMAWDTVEARLPIQF